MANEDASTVSQYSLLIKE